MRLKRVLCWMLILIFVGSAWTSCSSEKESENNTTEQITEAVTGTDEDGMKYTTVSLTDSGLEISASFDVNGNICSLPYTRDDFAEVAETFSEMGISRVYAVTSRPGIVGSSSAPNQWNDPGDNTSQTGASIIQSGDPNFEFVYACHKVGLEVIAVFKPYDKT